MRLAGGASDAGAAERRSRTLGDQPPRARAGRGAARPAPPRLGEEVEPAFAGVVESERQREEPRGGHPVSRRRTRVLLEERRTADGHLSAAGDAHARARERRPVALAEEPARARAGEPAAC